MSNEANPAVSFIDQLAKRLFDAIIRGDYNYERDIKALTRYQEQANKLDQPLLEARIVNVMAILNNVAGHYEDAEKYFLRVSEIYKEQNATDRLAQSYGNIGTLHSSRGEYEIAYDYIEKGLAIGSRNHHQFLLSNKMEILLIQERYDEIDACYEEVKKIAETPLNNATKAIFARFMANCYRVMAEVHLYRENQEKAMGAINMAHEFAEGLNLTFELANIYHTYAHIALSNHDEEQAEIYWDKARDTLKGIHSPSHVGRSYLEEARYLQRKGYLKKSEEFARRALNIFEHHEMSSDSILAKKLLA